MGAYSFLIQHKIKLDHITIITYNWNLTNKVYKNMDQQPNVQEVFDKVIQLGFYNQQQGSELMCRALKETARAGSITKEEFIIANEEIRNYLSGFGSLGGMLFHRGSPWEFPTRLAIYQDWKNRPTWK
jgi:hypothetical protein